MLRLGPAPYRAQNEENLDIPSSGSKNTLVDVSDIFLFFLLGGGEGGVRATGRGGDFIENPRGEVSPGGGGGARGPGAGLLGIWEREGLNIFFRCRNARQDTLFGPQHRTHFDGHFGPFHSLFVWEFI